MPQDWVNPTVNEQSEATRRALETLGNYAQKTLVYTKLTAAVATVKLTLPPNHPYDTIECVYSMRSTTATSVHQKVNGDAGANYFSSLLYAANGGAPATFNETSITNGLRAGLTSDAPNRWSTTKITFADVRNRSTDKMSIFQSGSYFVAGGTYQTESGFSLWAGIGPLLSLTVGPDSGTFAAGSSFHIYGIQ